MASSPRSDEELTELYERHLDTVYRVCFSFMKEPADTEDMVQETFLKLLSCGKTFSSAEHEKAWLIVVAANTCRDALRHWWRRKEDLEQCRDLAQEAPFAVDGVLSAVLALPVAYKETVYLYYYEGYSTPEIADLLQCSQSTVRNRLARARRLLEKSMKEEL